MSKRMCSDTVIAAGLIAGGTVLEAWFLRLGLRDIGNGHRDGLAMIGKEGGLRDFGGSLGTSLGQSVRDTINQPRVITFSPHKVNTQASTISNTVFIMSFDEKGWVSA